MTLKQCCEESHKLSKLHKLFKHNAFTQKFHNVHLFMSSEKFNLHKITKRDSWCKGRLRNHLFHMQLIIVLWLTLRDKSSSCMKDPMWSALTSWLHNQLQQRWKLTQLQGVKCLFTLRIKFFFFANKFYEMHQCFLGLPSITVHVARMMLHECIDLTCCNAFVTSSHSLLKKKKTCIL